MTVVEYVSLLCQWTQIGRKPFEGRAMESGGDGLGRGLAGGGFIGITVVAPLSSVLVSANQYYRHYAVYIAATGHYSAHCLTGESNLRQSISPAVYASSRHPSADTIEGHYLCAFCVGLDRSGLKRLSYAAEAFLLL